MRRKAGAEPNSDAASRPALEARGLSKSFGGVHAVSDVSLTVARGEVCGLIGPNGAGKTTLFDLLSGVTKPTAGSVYLDGKDVTRRSPTWRARYGVRRTFQRQQPFGWLSVEDNLLVALEWRGPGLPGPHRARTAAAHRLQVDAVLEMLDLEPLRRVPAAGLTIGQARLVEMARAVVASPRVLLLDEPTSGLAVAEAEQVAQAIQKVGATCAVVLVEHDVPFVLRCCDRIVVLNTGSVLATGTPAEIRNNDAVAAAYLGVRSHS